MTLITQHGTASSEMLGLRYPKIMLWGDTGEGKTITALYVMKELGLRMVGVDGDGGLGAYAGEWPTWMNLPVEDPVLVGKFVEELLVDPQGYQLCLIDPVTMMWRRSQHESDQYERSREGKGSLSVYAPVLHQASWGPIKRLAFMLANNARRLGMSLIITARETILYRRSGGQSVAVGVKPDCEANLPYEFDVVIHMQSRGEGGPREAVVGKDRWNRLPRVIQGSPQDIFYVGRALVEHYRDKFLQDPTANPRAEADQVRELYELQRRLNLDPTLIPNRLTTAYGVANYSELTPAQAGEVLGLYRNKTNNQQQP